MPATKTVSANDGCLRPTAVIDTFSKRPITLSVRKGISILMMREMVLTGKSCNSAVLDLRSFRKERVRVRRDDAPASGTHSARLPSGRGARDLF
jgi:hypothetical protein